MKSKKIYHLNDRTMKYKTYAQSMRQHQYLGLPGEFKTSYPQEVVFPNMDAGRMDALYSTTENMLIDLEEETGEITEKTLRKFGKYVLFVGFMYSVNVYLAVICHKDPKKKVECYSVGPSIVIEVHYCYFKQDELWDKYNNLISKVKQKIELTDNEALDMLSFQNSFQKNGHRM